jgi:hypothetical protein
VIWTKPGDFDIDQPDLIGRLGGFSRGRIIIAMGDAAIRDISSDVTEEQLRPVFTMRDGVQVDLEALSRGNAGRAEH